MPRPGLRISASLQVCANCSILEAVVSCPAVHIVDIGTGHGLHLLPLLRALAVRPQSAGGPPRLHLTLADLRTTQMNRAYCLLETAERLKVRLSLSHWCSGRGRLHLRVAAVLLCLPRQPPRSSLFLSLLCGPLLPLLPPLPYRRRRLPGASPHWPSTLFLHRAPLPC